MIPVKNTKDKERKVNKSDQKKILNYQGLPGVYTFVREVTKRTQEDRTTLWKQQKGL